MFSFILGVIVLILLGVMVWEGTDPSLQEFVLYDEARSRVILFSSASQCLVGTPMPTPTPTPAQAGKRGKRGKREREWESARYRCHRLARHRKRIAVSDGSVYTLEMEVGTRGVYVNREEGVTLLRIVAPGPGPSTGIEDLGENTAIDIESTMFPYHRLMFSGDRILLWKRGVFGVESYVFDHPKKSFTDSRGQSVTIWLYPEENKMVWVAATAAEATTAAEKEDYQTLRISWIPSAFGA